MSKIKKLLPGGSQCSLDHISVNRQSSSELIINSPVVSVKDSRDSLDKSDTTTEISFGTEMSKFMRAALSGTSYDIARLVHYMYKDSYRVARLKTKSWYFHDGMKWKPTEVGPYFELSTSIAQLFETYLHMSSNTPSWLEETETNQNIISKEREKKIETIKKILSKLKNVNTKELICKECVYLFYDPDFLTKLDTSPHIVCFNNGVLDLEKDDFRQGTSDDMISLHIDINFVPPKLQKDHSELAIVIEQFQEFRMKIVNKRKNRYIFSMTS